MLVALGLLTAGFVILLILPFYRRRAERLAIAEVKRQLPMTEAEIRADKDRLRAEYAIRIHQLESRVDDGRKIWKLSPMDLKSYDKWDDYTRARDRMFQETDTPYAPWYVARSEDKKRVRLNVISHLLASVPYKKLPQKKVELTKRKIGAYKAVDYPFKYVPDLF